MKRLVADAGVLADWFTGGSPLRTEYEAGALVLVEPRSVAADLVAELDARAHPDPETLVLVGDEIDRLGFELRDPPSRDVARWVARGLDPRRAAYASVADAQDDLALVTDDEVLRRIAGARSRSAAEA